MTTEADEEYLRWRREASTRLATAEHEPVSTRHSVYFVFGLLALFVSGAIVYGKMYPDVPPPPEPKEVRAPQQPTAPEKPLTAHEQHAQWCQMTLEQRRSFGYPLPCPGDDSATGSRAIVIVVPNDP